MKKITLLFLSLLLCLSLAGCQFAVPGWEPATQPSDTAPQPTPPETTLPEPTEPEPTIPEGSILGGIDLTSLSLEEAVAAIKEHILEYSLTVQADDKFIVFSAQQLELTLNEEALIQYLTQLNQDPQATPAGLASCNSQQVVSTVGNYFVRDPNNASVSYSSDARQFIITPGEDGTGVTLTGAAQLIDQAVGALNLGVSLPVEIHPITPAYTAEDPLVQQARDEANDYLNTDLTYLYQGTPHAVGKGQLSSFIHIDSNFNVSLNENSIRDYVLQMANTYPGDLTHGLFKTTHGSTIGYTVDYYSSVIDVDAMLADLTDCLKNHISGVREIPFLSTDNLKPYGGNYVEINLTDQRLWVYKNGNLVVQSPLVSGCVAANHHTPTGIFAIDDKDTNCYLVGATWREFVYYWLGFNGPIGMHDATWRGIFGGDIYLYNGSHGCVNLPLGNMPDIFNNVTVGTKVIVYGGQTYVDKLEQALSGTAAYQIAENTDPFALNVTTLHAVPALSYACDNEAVVTVDAEGIVTVQGIGSATITVTSPKTDIINSATMTITVTVGCTEGNHQVSQWSQSEAPICQESTVCGICDRCGLEQTQILPAQPHVFDGPYCQYGCGTANPDYQPPEEETTVPSTGEPALPPEETTLPQASEEEASEP